MKRPKLPKSVFFIDQDGCKVSEGGAWKQLLAPDQEITVRIAVRGIPREFRLRRGEIVRVLFGENGRVPLENYVKFEQQFEDGVEEFVACAMIWAKEQRNTKERRASAWRRLRSFPETNRIMSPTRFKTSPGQSRLNFR